MNMTNSTRAISDLISRSDEENDEIFEVITQCLAEIYINFWYFEKIDYSEYDSDTMSIYFACNIYKYLFESSYIYRVNCLFHEKEQHAHELFHDGLWPLDVGITLKDQKKGLDVLELQGCWDNMAYACKICKVEIGYFE